MELVFFTDFSLTDIGRRLGITRQAVRQRMESALVSLGIWEPMGMRARPQKPASEGREPGAESEDLEAGEGP